MIQGRRLVGADALRRPRGKIADLPTLGKAGVTSSVQEPVTPEVADVEPAEQVGGER